MLSPPGVQSHILMLAENDGDKTRWVGALSELHKVLRKNKIPDKSVCTQNLADTCSAELTCRVHAINLHALVSKRD